jgi:subtilisin family serine protease
MAAFVGSVSAGASGNAVSANAAGRLERIGTPVSGLAPVAADGNGPVHVIIGLSQRSLAAEQSYREASGLPLLTEDEQGAYVASLRQAQAPIAAALQAAGGKVLYQYQVVYNGLAASASRATLSQVALMPAIQQIQATKQATIALDNSVPFILGGKSYGQLGADGTGVTIAIIDSGIDYTHAAFGGAGTPGDYAANDPTIIEGGSFPTAKVIGGYDFVGEDYDARGATAPGGVCTDTPVPDPDPLDINGHGTHSASTAAGMDVVSGGMTLTYHGVAPGAKLYAFKIFSGCAIDGTASTDTSNVIAGIERAMDPNQDGKTKDHVGVISMSLGSRFGRDTAPDSVASNAAVALGAIVVAAAGNAGDIPYIQDSPGSATGVISVAAGNDPGVSVQLLNVAGSSDADGDYESVEGAITVPLATTGAVSGLTVSLGETCSALAPGSLTGKIPLIARGTCTFASKILNAQAAGAVAVVMTNNVPGAPIIMGGSSAGITIPGVMISLADGNAIRAALLAGTTLTLDPTNQLSIPDRLASFTSRGPRFGDSALKPDIVAPGVNILSAEVGTGTDSSSVSGTSFSTPHIAGAAAILRQLHPKWSVGEIKAALMNTATDTFPDGTTAYPLALEGAGRARVDVAAKVSSVVTPGSASFGVKEGDDYGKKVYGVTLTLRNKGSTFKLFSLSWAFRDPALNDGTVKLLVPPSLAVTGGRTASFTVWMVVDFDKLPAGASFAEYEGFVTLTQTKNGNDVLRVPFYVLPIARADASARPSWIELPDHDTLKVRNTGIRPTDVDIYQLGVKNPRKDLIAEGPGMPNEPDAWFNVRYTGAHTYDVEGLGQILEFGTVVWGRRSTPNNMVTDIYIDVDGGAPDYLVEVADLGLLTTGTVNGQMASAVFGLPSFAGFLEFVVSNEKNTAWQTAPILLDDLNFIGTALGLPTIDPTNTTISYFVVTTDLGTDAQDVTAAATFNVIAPTIQADPFYFTADPWTTTKVTVSGTEEGALLLIYYNNEAGADQGQVVHVDIDD